MAQLYFDTVEVGDPIPTLQKPPINRTQISRFAAASGDYGPLHVDEEVGRASGYGSVMAHGMIAMGYVGEMLEKWLTNGRVARLDVRFLKFIWPGDVLSAKGVVVPKPEGDTTPGIVCDVWVQNQNNDKVLQGKAVCVLFANAEEEKKKGGGKPPAVFIAADYVSPSRKTDMGRSAAGPADKPPARPPPKAAGTPVKLTDEAVEIAKQQEDSERKSQKAKPEAAKAKPAKVEPAKSEPPKPAAKSTPPKPAPAKVEAKKPEPKKPDVKKPEAKKVEAKPAPKKEAPKPAKPEAKKPEAKPVKKEAPKPAAKKEAPKPVKKEEKKKKK